MRAGNRRETEKSAPDRLASVKVNYIYSAAGKLLMEDKVSDGTWNHFIYYNGQVVAMRQQNDYFRLLFKDHLGSTRSVVEVRLPQSWDWQTNWSAIAFYDYDPYGRVRSQSEPGGSTNYRYTGKERDASGLDYFGARYYDGQNLAFRWISADSVTARVYDPRSLNKYTYCRADPINLIDPDGRVVLDPEDDSWINWGIFVWFTTGIEHLFQNIFSFPANSSKAPWLLSRGYLNDAVTAWAPTWDGNYRVTLTGLGFDTLVSLGFTSVSSIVESLPCPVPSLPCAVINGVKLLVTVVVSATAIVELYRQLDRACPPCRLEDGTIVPLRTQAYRLDTDRDH